MFDFRKTFRPTDEEKEEQERFYEKIHAELVKAKECCVCANGKKKRVLAIGGVWDTETVCALGIERCGECDKWEETK